MKRFISISLIICLVLQTFTSLSFLTFYQFNKSLISEVFCVNKSKPSLHCQGKCFIKKQLAKEQETSRQTTEQKETIVFHLFMPQLSSVKLESFFNQPEAPVAFYRQKPLQFTFFSTFHPPRFSEGIPANNLICLISGNTAMSTK